MFRIKCYKDKIDLLWFGVIIVEVVVLVKFMREVFLVEIFE